MDFTSTVVHELQIIWVDSISLILLVLCSSLLKLDWLFWPGLLIIIVTTFIQDYVADQPPQTIGMKFIKVFTNFSVCFCAMVCVRLVCRVLDDVEYEKGDGTVVSLECDYGKFGLVIAGFLCVFFLISLIWTMITAAILFLDLVLILVQFIWTCFRHLMN